MNRNADDREPVTTTEPDRMTTRRGETEPATANGTRSVTDGNVELLPASELEGFRSRWDRVQVEFVDRPREAVQSAHDLVDEVVDTLTKSFSAQRADLESTWSRGGDVSTEDLRVALQRYRSLFNRLLST